MIPELHAFQNVAVLVVGDAILDRYLWGDVERISPEAPVPVVRVEAQSASLGGAANVAGNLASLGCAVHLLGGRGADAPGAELKELLRAAKIRERLLLFSDRGTTTKTRVMARRQQLLRIDDEVAGAVSAEFTAALSETALEVIRDVQAVVISDYGKGIVTGDLCRALVNASRAQGLPVIVDPKGADWERYRGASCVTPNASEFSAVAGTGARQESELAEQARSVRVRYGLDRLLVTRGPKGVLLVEDGSAPPLAIPARAREVFDVSGAGDTVIAVLAAAVAAGWPWAKAAALANAAAGIVVGKVGTHPITLQELQSEVLGEELKSRSKVLDVDTAVSAVDSWRSAGEKIVFTNGCFDLLHPGHVTLLRTAASHGDRLVVGLNTDASVRRLKGPLRPILPEEDRAALLAALQYVDLVVLFDQDTPLGLIRRLRPDVLVKGADYTVETVVGSEDVRTWGGRVVLVPFEKEVSTTDIVDRIRKLQ